jgi:hypothetical protein
MVRHRLIEYRAHLHHCKRRGRRHNWAEVHLCVAKGQIAVSVRGVRAHKSQISLDGLRQDTVSAIKIAHFLSLREISSKADGCIEGWDTGTASSDTLHKGTLWHAFKFDLALDPQALEW